MVQLYLHKYMMVFMKYTIGVQLYYIVMPLNISDFECNIIDTYIHLNYYEYNNVTLALSQFIINR